MNWLTNFIRPKIQSIVEQKEVPDNLWQKCPSCEGMLFHRDIEENLDVCYHCGHHMRIPISKRLSLLFDDGKFKKIALPGVAQDPLKFKDKKRYTDRLRDSRNKTKEQDAIIVAQGTIGDMPVVIAAFNFAFMGGSMGIAVGEGIVNAAETAVREKAALIVIPASGGARMQEGLLSLMQMPRSIIAADRVKDAGLPYLVLLTDPTTGGVSASFAMVGDIHIAEPGCMIGFAGKRVIQETIREELPDDFQTAEYLLEHGMVDMVVPRKELRDTFIRILDLLLYKSRDSKVSGKNNSGNSQAKSSGQKNGKNGKNGGTKATAKKRKVKVSRKKEKTGKKPANTNTDTTVKAKKAAGS
jgi:acetyl-CoA carboxylase carboxyl transferase subunit beta